MCACIQQVLTGPCLGSGCSTLPGTMVTPAITLVLPCTLSLFPSLSLSFSLSLCLTHEHNHSYSWCPSPVHTCLLSSVCTGLCVCSYNVPLWINVCVSMCCYLKYFNMVNFGFSNGCYCRGEIVFSFVSTIIRMYLDMQFHNLWWHIIYQSHTFPLNFQTSFIVSHFKSHGTGLNLRKVWII